MFRRYLRVIRSKHGHTIDVLSTDSGVDSNVSRLSHGFLRTTDATLLISNIS